MKRLQEAHEAQAFICVAQWRRINTLKAFDGDRTYSIYCVSFLKHLSVDKHVQQP